MEELRPWHPFRLPGLCGLRGTMLIFSLITLVIIPAIFWCEVKITKLPQPVNHSYADTPETRFKRALGTRIGPLNLEFVEGEDGVATFDFCSVARCSPHHSKYVGAEKYACDTTSNKKWCNYWSYVIANSGYTDWGYRPPKASKGPNPLKQRLTLLQEKVPRQCKDYSCNPLILTLKRPALTDSGMYVLGAHVSGRDPLGQFTITVKPKTDSDSPASTDLAHDDRVKYLNFSTPEGVIAFETGFTERNIWLDWMYFTANTHNFTNCIVCTTPRPTLYTVPAPLLPHYDPQGFECMLQLHMTPTPTHCSALSKLFPVAANDVIPPVFTPKEGLYTCLTRNNVTQLGNVLPDWCNITLNVTSRADMGTLKIARADLFWFCGGKTLYNVLPKTWSGTCTLVRLAFPITLLGQKQASSLARRHKRTVTSDDFDLTKNTPTYFDAIGVPRGVPDEYKLASPIGNGFESILPWVTTNKNVDRINYVHFNVQRLANLTRDAVAGLSEQLAATSLMTVQNRLALDMLLAEKGGVCSMIDGSCCTFIPNNTAPDGSVTKALNGLRALSDQMAEDSGVDSPFHDWMSNMFGKWKGLLISVMVSIGVFAGILTCCGCCFIPCLRTLVNRLITTALSKENQPPPYQLPLLAGVDDDLEMVIVK